MKGKDLICKFIPPTLNNKKLSWDFWPKKTNHKYQLSSILNRFLYFCTFWSSVNHYVVICRTKCNIIWRVLNIYERAIII